MAKTLALTDTELCISSIVPHLERFSPSNRSETVQRIKEPLTMKTIEARITTNIKEDPSIEECDIWNIQATFLDPLPSDATDIMADPIEIGVKQLEAARTDGTRTAVTIRTQQKSRLQPGELIHLGFEQE